MTSLHVVYRVDDPGTATEQWASYSFPHSIYVSGSTLDEVRTEFRSAAAFALPDLDIHTAVEHVERPLAPGAYIRTAVDRRTLDRDDVAQTMRNSLQVVGQWKDFQAKAPASSTGDTVMIACVPEDRLGWVFEQMVDEDGLGLCAAGPVTGVGRFVWWSYIFGPKADVGYESTTESLADAGLTADSSVAEFMRVSASSTGRRLAEVAA